MEEILETIRRLSALPHLEPAQVSTCLGLRHRLLSEERSREWYCFGGGCSLPFYRGDLRWLPKGVGGVLVLTLAEGQNLSVDPFEKSLKAEGLPHAYLRIDPDDPDPKMCIVFKAPVGEIRLVFRHKEENAPLVKIVLSEFPQVRWQKSGQGSPGG